MTVGSLICVIAWQVHRCHDLPDQILPLQNAPIGEQFESPNLRVVHHPAPRHFLVFHVVGSDAVSLEQRPNINMAPRMRKVISVWLSLAQWCAVNDRLATDYPKDANVGFFLPTPGGGFIPVSFSRLP